MGLVHSKAEVWEVLDRDGYLECPRCHEPVWSWDDLTWSMQGVPLCPYCRNGGDRQSGGFIPHRHVEHKIDLRYGEAVASHGWWPAPHMLLEHAEALKLTAHDLLVVWALERHNFRGEVFPSVKTLARLTRLSPASVKRSTAHLRELKYLQTRPGSRWENSGKFKNTLYSLDDLWLALARLSPPQPEEPEDDEPGGAGRRCTAMNVSGERCSGWAVDEGGLCGTHRAMLDRMTTAGNRGSQ